jgi:hypothetical protein
MVAAVMTLLGMFASSLRGPEEKKRGSHVEFAPLG